MSAYKNSNHLVVLAESEEAASILIDQNIGKVFETHGSCLLDLHITDQEVYNKYKMFLRARILIGSKHHEDALAVLAAIFKIVDKVTRLTLSQNNLLKAERQRKKVENVKNKEEDEKKEAILMQKKRDEE